jgi:two-component system sensor histidine kinase UhpB
VSALAHRPGAFPAGLHDRVSLLVTLLAAGLLLLSGGWWAVTTRDAIHEEVEAAAKVTEQWLGVLIKETRNGTDTEVLVDRLARVGRVRANVLEAWGHDGTLRYRSPGSTYKAGRDAPAWFAHLLTPGFEERELLAPGLRIRLRPDPSRAVLDAWDQMFQFAGWALAGLAALAFAVRRAIDRALAPLTGLERALERTADGEFDIRLPAGGSAELDRLATRYNHMAARLEQSLVRNARLEEDQAFIRAVNARLEDERRTLARELHDEFGQGITAVRAIAGAIAQRSAGQPGLHGSAQAILAMTSQMQDGVRGILNRLRRHEGQPIDRLDAALAEYCRHWAGCYPDLTLEQHLDPVGEPLAEAFCLTLLRLLQESLTNVARHAHARRVEVWLSSDARGLQLCVSDDGRGFDADQPTERYGLAGMRERVAEHGGQMRIETPAAGGTRILIALPWPAASAAEQDQPRPGLPARGEAAARLTQRPTHGDQA